MDGFTVTNGNRFLETGRLDTGRINSGESKIDSSSSQIETTGSGSFADTLKEAVMNVNEAQKNSDKAIQALATGKTDNVAEVMIATEKADIALKLMVQVRNKIIDAYQEVMKMQV
jgi:flagellar hook-basal body complex protein FliE